MHDTAELREILVEPELTPDRAGALFRRVVEAVGDAFDPELCDLYVPFAARVIQCCRRLPDAARVDRLLGRFGLASEQDLIGRAERVRRGKPARWEAGRAAEVRKVVVLSRVTLGADVAVTSVALRKMAQCFPNAGLALVAGRQAALLFSDGERVRVREVAYPRGGPLAERLDTWPAVAEAVEDEVSGLGPGEYLVLDPDSRLTQLGMLPVVADESSYLFFESRSYSKPGIETLGELTADWLGEGFGVGAAPVYPWVSVRQAAAPAGRWASVNLGVGDNPRKRLADPFEEQLLDGLLAGGWKVFLDYGAGEEETTRVGRLLGRLGGAGRKVAEIEDTATALPAGVDVVAWRGSLAGFGGLITASRLYVGYDSACAHIAAALGVPVIDIFAGYAWPRMVERWRPWGPGRVTMVVVDPQEPVDGEKALDSVLEAAR